MIPGPYGGRIVIEGEPDPDVVLQYTHVSGGKKESSNGSKVSGINSTVPIGMTNAGFEKEITRRGFDWRYWEDKKENWEIRRINSAVSDESHALRIWFAGEENISFHHFYQIVPVKPLEPYRLSYRWKKQMDFNR